MPAFTLPIGTEVTVTSMDGEQESTILPETFTVSWEENKAERDKKKKQMIKYSPPIPLPLNFAVGTDYHVDDLLDTLSNSVPTPQLQFEATVAECKKKIKEHNMSNNIYATAASVNSTVPTDQKQRDYTLGRLYELKASKKRELEIKFGLRGDETPETFHDFMDRLTSGKFTFPEDKKDKYIGTYGILDYIRWRDPSVKEDDAGFRTAAEKLDEAYTTARDTVVLSAADQGLKIIEDFKSLKLS